VAQRGLTFSVEENGWRLKAPIENRSAGFHLFNHTD
jgi:hypothetical protein